MEKRKRPLGLVLIVAYKAIWGVLEVAAGAFVTSSPALLRGELTQDPQDQLAAWLLAHTSIEPGQLRAFSVGLMVLGVSKLVLAAGIWYGSWLVRDVALWVMGLAGLFAVGALAWHFTLFRLLVVATDLLIVLYLWRLLPKHLPPRPKRLARRVDATLVP